MVSRVVSCVFAIFLLSNKHFIDKSIKNDVSDVYTSKELYSKSNDGVKKKEKVRQQEIANIVESIDDIKYANVFINGNSVVVGIYLEKELNSKEMKVLKTHIERCIREYDQTFKKVAITSSEGIIGKIIINKKETTINYNDDSQDIERKLEPL